ncbi:hypothetical protein [Taklimakanibacter lacteus]
MISDRPHDRAVEVTIVTPDGADFGISGISVMWWTAPASGI